MADWRARPSRSAMTRAMKESVKTGHPTGLPEKLLRLFAPNPPLAHIKENCKDRKPPRVKLSGIGGLVSQFAAPGDAEYEPPCPAKEQFAEPRLLNNKEYAYQARLDEETKLEKKKRLHDWRTDKAKTEVEEKGATYDPNNDPMVEGDPYKTLFVSRLSYEVTERKLRHEFEEYGPIKRIRLVHDRNTDKPRGYAFIEYEHKADMKEAYKQSDGRKVEGRRILVDVERGRTVENWRPMRLAGGLGGDSRLPKEPRKKLLAEAAAKGIALPSAAAAGAIRRDEPARGPPGGGYGGPPRGGGYGGGGGYSDRGPPRGGYDSRGGGGGYDSRGGGGGYDSRGGGGYDSRGGGSGGYDSRGGGRDYGRDRYGDRDKRGRDGSPSRDRDYKRSRHDDDRRRYDRDY